MDDDLEARLESHAQAFEGLLSLIPAKEYYGADNSDQWQRKKQTKEQKRAAKMAKLDPANQKTAKDVMDENERKRKRELGIESEGEADFEPSSTALRPKSEDGARTAKKLKTNKEQPTSTADDEAARKKIKAEKRKEKRDRKKEKSERKKEKTDAKKARKQEQTLQESRTEPTVREMEDVSGDEAAGEGADEIEHIDASGLVEDDVPRLQSPSSVPTSPELDSPAFDVSANHSTASSSSSIVPPATAPALEKTTAQPQPVESTANTGTDSPSTKKEKAFNMPKIDSEELQARLRARIEELRMRRKADNADGAPARSRQELLEARRKKSEARKQHKKDLRQKAKDEEERLENERLRGSGSPLNADPFSPRSPMPQDNNFSFGNVAFGDGAVADPTLKGAFTVKKKGAQDPKTALLTAQKKAQRISGLDEEKRADVQEKDLWLNARKRAHGERVRDDQSLLKKALKRKEKTKSKSEKEWNERIEGVRKGKEVKQKKREDNLAKRKDEKGGKKGKAQSSKGAKGKKKGRPGFEGKFRS